MRIPISDLIYLIDLQNKHTDKGRIAMKYGITDLKPIMKVLRSGDWKVCKIKGGEL